MDKTQAWRITRQHAKTAATWTAEKGRWTAGKWRAEADRRSELRAELRPIVKANRKAVRHNRKVDPEKLQPGTHLAERRLRDAQRQVPDTLLWLATKTAAGVGILAWWGLPKVPADVWRWTAVAAGAAAVAGVGWLIWRISRHQEPELVPTAEEAKLLARLQPEHWREHAELRGLAGTLTGRPELTESGIVCGVRLDGKWSAKALAAQADQVRALLGMKADTRMQISRGSHGDRALIVIRTRSASDGVSVVWTPDHQGIGVCEVTGEYVDLPLKAGKHILAAGRTGMGKSVSWRPLVMRAVMADDWTAVVIDPKRQEAIGWQHCLRCVGQETNREERMGRIYAMAKELTGEMHRRQGIATGATWVPDGRPENRNLLVVIDEGAAIVRMSKQKQYADVLDLFEELWSEARSVGFQFVWATQFPTKAVGVPAAVKENMSAFLSLTVNPGEAERAIFGETAQQEGWLPSRLDGIPGRAMLQFEKRTPDPLRLWHVTDGTIASLPKADPWTGPTEETAPPVTGRPALSLVRDSVYEDAVPAPRPAAEGADGKVMAALGAGPLRQKDISEATGLAKGTVSKAVGRLVAAGHLTQLDGGLYGLANAKEA